jgi:large subunit ribosomal protein L54
LIGFTSTFAFLGAFKAGMTVQKKKMEVETDPHKLVNYLCGGQYMKEGPEIKLKADDEYPEWICTLRTNGVPELHELDPDSLEYWEKIRSLKRVTNNQLMKAVKGRRWLIKKERPNYKKLE